MCVVFGDGVHSDVGKGSYFQGETGGVVGVEPKPRFFRKSWEGLQGKGLCCFRAEGERGVLEALVGCPDLE